MLFLQLFGVRAAAHSIHYRVENKGVSVRFFYSPDDSANDLTFEVLGPGDGIPHQKGRTDKNGFVSFLPDRAGKWIIKVSGESDHGCHGRQVEITVDKNLFVESFKKPPVATHTKLFVGLGFIFGIFGLLAMLKANNAKRNGSSSE